MGRKEMCTDTNQRAILFKEDIALSLSSLEMGRTSFGGKGKIKKKLLRRTSRFLVIEQPYGGWY